MVAQEAIQVVAVMGADEAAVLDRQGPPRELAGVPVAALAALVPVVVQIDAVGGRACAAHGQDQDDRDGHARQGR